MHPILSDGEQKNKTSLLLLLLLYIYLPFFCFFFCYRRKSSHALCYACDKTIEGGLLSKPSVMLVRDSSEFSLSLSLSLSALSPLSLLSLSPLSLPPLSLPPTLISSPISYSTSTTRNPTKIYK